MVRQLVPVKKNATEGFLEVLLHACHGLLENIEVRRFGVTVGALRGEIVIDDLVHGMGVRKRNELVVLRHVLPIIDQNRLDMIRNRKLDGRARMESILL